MMGLREELLNKVSEKASEVEQIFKNENIRGYVMGMVAGEEKRNDLEGIISIHTFVNGFEHYVDYTFKDLDAETYYYNYLLDFKNLNTRGTELNCDEKYLLDILELNNIELSVFSNHVLSFEYSEENAVDIDKIVSFKYNNANKEIIVECNSEDNLDIVIDLKKRELRFIPDGIGVELSFFEYDDYMSEQYKKEKKQKEEKQEDDIKEYETTDLMEFLDWMEEFNKQDNNEYELIIQNKHITQISEDEEYQFCAIDSAQN